MHSERIYPEMADAHDAVVTYSRVPARQRGRRLVEIERIEPVLDAAEIPLADPHDDSDPAFAVAPRDLRADPADPGAGFVDEPRKSGSTRYLVAAAALAILAGVGILAASVGIATIAPTGAPVETGVAETPLQLANSDPAPDAAPAPTPVREIPLTAGEEAPAAEAVETVPPVPRPRPDADAASFKPETGVASTSTPAVAKTSGPEHSGANPSTTASVEPGAPSGGTDALIMRIEETLSKVDSPPAGTSDAFSPPPLLLPPPAAGPPVAMDPLAYPPVDGGYAMPEESWNPSYDLMPPPPVTDNGYYPAGPVPPAPVPYAYPDAEPGYSDGSSARRPGIVTRAITKTADAFGRVFSRDR